MLRLEDYIDSKNTLNNSNMLINNYNNLIVIVLELEHLPQNMRNNFMELREMDLHVERKYKNVIYYYL